MLLEGKTCVVTGAASARGIGRGIAHLFAEHGGRIAILDLDRGQSEAAAAALPGNGHSGLACDVTDRQRCADVIARIVEQCGGLNVLVNNAGNAQPHKMLDVEAKDYDITFDVNMRGVFNMCQAALPHMQARKQGSIVNISSVAAQRGGGIFGGPHYAAAKGGVLSLTKAIAREFGPDNIRANAVCPSLVETDIHGGGITPEMRATILSSIPLGRIGTTADIAGACLFLASGLSGFVTGTTIDVNGGSHIH